MQNREPRHGDVYRDEKGQLLLYVRTEARSGTNIETGAPEGEPEHLFVVQTPRVRHFATRWLPASQPLPSGVELAVNAQAEERIAELEGRVGELEAERAALVAAMKTAVGALPMEVANHLRKTYRETRGRLLTKGEK